MESDQSDKYSKYISPHYRERLERLAELLVQPRQLKLFENVVELRPVEESPLEAA